MQIFIESIDKGIWDAIINGPYTPKCLVENKQVDKPWTEWTGMKEGEELIMIAMPRISSLHL